MTDRRFVLSILAALAVGTPAIAQNALGDGRGLQRTGVMDTRPVDFAREVRLRNAVVTGNAPAGRSLQIAAPYSDADDFRSALGTDSLFRFRRDSYGGGLGVGFRGTESIQYQYAFTTGNARDPGLFTRYAGGTTPVPGSPAPTATYASTIFDRGGSDAIAPEFGTLRSTASFNAVRGLSPSIVGIRQTREGIERVTASSLLGVRSTLLVPDMMTGRYVDPEDRRVTTSASPVSPTTTPNLTAGPGPVEEPKTKTSFDALLDRLRAVPETKNTTPEVPVAPEATPTPGTTPGTTHGGVIPVVPVAPEIAWEKTLREMRQKLTSTDTLPSSSDKAGFTPQDEDLLRAIRESSSEVSAYLIQNPNPGDLFGEHIKEGEGMIATRQYFDAEERFARALAMQPGDVTAMAGRVHAQLGGGLFLSAAMNLRQMFQQHPEAVATRFTGNTMPDPERMKFLKLELGALLDDSANKRRLPNPEAALLLAYAGYQTADRAAVERGLRVLDVERAARAEALGEPPPTADPLIAVLRAAWLRTPLPTAPEAPPAVAPAAEPAPK